MSEEEKIFNQIYPECNLFHIDVSETLLTLKFRKRKLTYKLELDLEHDLASFSQILDGEYISSTFDYVKLYKFIKELNLLR